MRVRKAYPENPRSKERGSVKKGIMRRYWWGMAVMAIIVVLFTITGVWGMGCSKYEEDECVRLTWTKGGETTEAIIFLNEVGNVDNISFAELIGFLEYCEYNYYRKCGYHDRSGIDTPGNNIFSSPDPGDCSRQGLHGSFLNENDRE